MPGPVLYGAVPYSYTGYSLNYQRYHIVNGIIWEPGTGERETHTKAFPHGTLSLAGKINMSISDCPVGDGSCSRLLQRDGNLEDIYLSLKGYRKGGKSRKSSQRSSG